jgi:hypothetical protein
MKTRFLDARNCHALLPKGTGLSFVQRLEECLANINSAEGPLSGQVDRLIHHNQKTIDTSVGYDRLIASPVEVGQMSFLSEGVVNVRAAERTMPGPAHLHTSLIYEDGTMWKTIIPLQFVLKGWGNAKEGHQCYVHTITHNLNKVRTQEDWMKRMLADEDEYYYVGITGRDWLLRFSEHMGEMRRGSRKRFHNMWRESIGMNDVCFVSSLLNVNLSYEDAMNWEEEHVEKYAYGPHGMNMISGGFKGLRELHKMRITDRVDITLEERDRAIGEYLRQNPRKGVPNPFVAELWKDDAHYLKVMESNPRTLSADQVRAIRELDAGGMSVEDITEKVGALNEIQVKKVIAGITYKRVK